MVCVDLNDCLEFIERNEQRYPICEAEDVSFCLASRSYDKLMKSNKEDLSKNPKCSCCKKHMPSTVGNYGKFYFCKCPNQKSISDKQWQVVKNKV